MTAKERVAAALRGEQPDRVPLVECMSDWEPMVRLAGLLGVEVPGNDEPFAAEELSVRLTQALGTDAPWVCMSLGPVPLGDGLIRDRYGSVYLLSEHGEPAVVEGPVSSLSDAAGFDPAAGLSAQDFAAVRVVRGMLGEDRPVWFCFPGVFKLSWRLRGGMVDLLMDYLREPRLAHALARIATDAGIAMVQGAAAAGADAVIMEGDLGSNRGLLFSPAHYREFIEPYYAEIVAAAHDRGLPIVKHSCGAVRSLLDGFVELGFDGFHPVQPQCMDIAEVKASVGDRICLVGNIDCADLLVHGSEQEVADTVRRTIEVAAPGGGYILSTANSLHPGVRAENFKAMVEAWREYGGPPTALPALERTPRPRRPADRPPARPVRSARPSP